MSEKKDYRWVILGALFSLQSIISMVVYSFGPLAPFLREAFGITRVQVGVFTSLILLSSVLLSVPAGWLVDKFGVRRLLLLGAGMVGLCYALFSQVAGVSSSYVAVFLTGIGYVFVVLTTTMALVRWFPPRSRATAVSIKQSGVMVGIAMSAIIVPSLSLWLGWRNAVAILGVVAVMVVAAISMVYRESASQHSEPRAQVPVLATFRRVLVDKKLLNLGLVGGAYSALQMSILTYLVLHLVEARGLSVALAGTFLMGASLGGAGGRVLWGAISDRAFGGQRRPVLVIIGAISGSMALVLSIGGATLPGWLLYVTVVVLGVAALGWNGVIMTFATEISDRETAATGLGWVVTLITAGGVIGPPLFGYIVDRTSSYNPAWLTLGILTIVAAILTMLMRQRKAER